MEITTIAPELAAAIVAAHRACELLERDGVGDKGKYTTGDAVAAEARRVLNLHGAAWMLVDVVLEKPGLDGSDIGQQAYVGDIRETWMIVHESGAAITGDGRMPVVTSRGRPHDKAVGASLTYGIGVVLRGAMCLVREDKNAIDKRKDDEQSKPAEPIITEAMAKECRSRVEWIAAKANAVPGEVWAHFCEQAAIEPMDDGGPPRSIELTLAEGHRVLTLLGVEIKRLEAIPQTREREPGGDEGDGVPEDGAAALADVGRRVSSQFAGTTAGKPRASSKGRPTA